MPPRVLAASAGDGPSVRGGRNVLGGLPPCPEAARYWYPAWQCLLLMFPSGVETGRGLRTVRSLVLHAVGSTVQSRTPPDSWDTALKGTLYLVPSEKKPGTPIQVMQLWGWVELARFFVKVSSRFYGADLLQPTGLPMSYRTPHSLQDTPLHPCVQLAECVFWSLGIKHSGSRAVPVVAPLETLGLSEP